MVADGLVLSHIKSRSSVPTMSEVRAKRRTHLNSHPVTIRTYARMTSITNKTAGSVAKPGTWNKRGKVSEFSRQSRKRMIELLQKLRGVDHRFTYFVTLTYPGHFTSTAKEVKEHLRVFQMRFKRRFPRSGVVWRMELKKRKSGASEGFVVPHFHLIMCHMPIGKATLIRWVSTAWWEIVGSGDEDHKKAGTNVLGVHSFSHLMWYVSKYAAKDEDDEDALERNWGRRWGAWGEVDAAPLHTFRLTSGEYMHFRRIMVAWMRSRGNRYAGRIARQSPKRTCSVFGCGDEATPRLIALMVRHARQLAWAEQ